MAISELPEEEQRKFYDDLHKETLGQKNALYRIGQFIESAKKQYAVNALEVDVYRDFAQSERDAAMDAWVLVANRWVGDLSSIVSAPGECIFNIVDLKMREPEHLEAAAAAVEIAEEAIERKLDLWREPLIPVEESYELVAGRGFQRKPSWNGETLTCGKKKVQFKSGAANISALLNALENADWPRDKVEVATLEVDQISPTVRTLNARMKKEKIPIKFFGPKGCVRFELS